MPDRDPTQDDAPDATSGEPAAAADDADLADHPGRPRGKGEVDPELLRLRKPRGRVGWLLALSVVALCAFVMLELRADLAFSRQPDAPRELPSVDALLTAEVDSFVSLAAVPDRAYGSRVLPSKSSIGQRLFPLLGSDGRVWLLVSGSPWQEPATYSERWQGRVREVDDMPFSASLRTYLRELRPLPRHVTKDELRRALAGGDHQLRHASGDAIEVKADTAVRVMQQIPGRARITATATDDHPDEAAWRAALERAGVLPPNAPPESGDLTSWRYVVNAPNGAAAVDSRLAAAGLRAARAEAVVVDLTARWSELSASADSLNVGEVEVPWSSVLDASVAVRRSIPDGARVLVASEQPGDYWYLLPLFALLSLFALLFGWAFAQAMRSGRPAADAPGATASAA
jgi:hypothetical protein